MTVLTHTAYFAVVIILIALVPAGFVGDISTAGSAILVIGLLGIWRYSWASIIFVRAFIYRFFVHDRKKRIAFARYQNGNVRSHAYFMITSYMVDRETTLNVYRQLFRAAAQSKDGATIVSSVVDGADERLIREIYRAIPLSMANVTLIIDRIQSRGKRDAMVKALRILARYSPTPQDILVFVDGDTIVPLDIVQQSAPFFTNPKLGALTTNEAAIVDRDGLFRDWFTLRFNQRQIMMCSMALGKRVLTLTGRLSVFRANLATDPGFIQGIGSDFLNHWRLGRVNFLTGDDKSTWFWLLRNGFEMGYLPDVQSQSVETQPRPTFFGSAKTLMVRWFGNMLRTNGRALRLPPKQIGLFTWWSLLDQRLSMWTTLVGPISVVIVALFYSLSILPLYIAWVMVTRYLFCAIISLFNGTWFRPTHPFILYFGQVVGAAIKTFVFFRLDKQKWTRQGSSSGKTTIALHERLKSMESAVFHGLSVTWLTLAIVFFNSV